MMVVIFEIEQMSEEKLWDCCVRLCQIRFGMLQISSTITEWVSISYSRLPQTFLLKDEPSAVCQMSNRVTLFGASWFWILGITWPYRRNGARSSLALTFWGCRISLRCDKKVTTKCIIRSSISLLSVISYMGHMALIASPLWPWAYSLPIFVVVHQVTGSVDFM